MTIERVWIEAGCIRCSACAYTAPDVFALPDNGDAVVRGSARVDGVDSQNDEGAGLRPEVAEEHAERIRDAADGCPVAIIRFAEDDEQAAAAGASQAAEAV